MWVFFDRSGESASLFCFLPPNFVSEGEAGGKREEQQQAFCLQGCPKSLAVLDKLCSSVLCISNEELPVRFPLKKKLSEGDRLCSQAQC